MLNLPTELVLGVLSYVDPIDLLMFNQEGHWSRVLCSGSTDLSLLRCVKGPTVLHLSVPYGRAPYGVYGKKARYSNHRSRRFVRWT